MGKFNFSLACLSGIRCVIKSSTDLVNWTPVATNSDYVFNRLINLPVSSDANFYRAARDPVPLFAYALAAEGDIHISGNGPLTDSWNSHDTNQSADGHYNGYVGTNGDIASAQGLISIGNKTILGDVYVGSVGLIVGPGGYISGQIYAGGPNYFPDVSLPTKDDNGDAITWTPAPGTASTHTFTSSGYYVVSDNGQIIVSPGIKITLDVKVSNYNPSALTINGGTTNAGTVIMYQEAGSLSLSGTSSGGAVNNRPENFIYFGLPGVTQITMTGSGVLYTGIIYAPEASGYFAGGGSLGDFIGSCIVSNVIINGHFTFHFDESLLTVGPFY